MEPYFFGKSNHLFGIYHPCVSNSSRGGIIIAPPMLNEDIRTHFSLREMAFSLSRCGYDVFRFDFSGCGDSFGDLTSIRVENWINDIKEAICEFREIARPKNISVISARFSSCIAAAVSKSTCWDLMIMWDPILKGSDWIYKMEKMSSGLKGVQSLVKDEYLGEQVNPSLKESVFAFHVSEITARRIIAIVTDDYIDINPSWDCRRLLFDSCWDESLLENLFSHQIISEVTGVFIE